MISTRRGFLSTLAGLAAASPWRAGRRESPPLGAHDTSPPTATATASPEFLDLAETEAWLDAWQGLPRVPLVREQFPQFGKDRQVEWFHASLITCRIREGRSFDFLYQGGSEPGTWRNVLPVLLFTVPAQSESPDLTREPVYLLAHCLKRNAVRTFRLDRIAA